MKPKNKKRTISEGIYIFWQWKRTKGIGRTPYTHSYVNHVYGTILDLCEYEGATFGHSWIALEDIDWRECKSKGGSQ
jgi:hypothetical protein